MTTAPAPPTLALPIVAPPALDASTAERAFADRVDEVASDPRRADELADLLREDHPVYVDRGGGAVARMRGWLLVAVGRVGVNDATARFAAEELQTGTDPYLVGAAARALRTVARPADWCAPLLLAAIDNARSNDLPICLSTYGGHAPGPDATTPVRELLATLESLGPDARGWLADVEALRSGPRRLPPPRQAEVARAVAAIRGDGDGDGDGDDPAGCCRTPAGPPADAVDVPRWSRRSAAALADVTFEDHDGAAVRFADFFGGVPAVVVFFYTRCDNPQKCSLTVTKLARVQRLLESRGLAGRARTAAVTYDPAYDDADRLRAYAVNRGVRLDRDNRALRTTAGFDALRAHLGLGVGYVGSLVNRHRIEVFLLDRRGRVAAVFDRLHWGEDEVAARAAALAAERGGDGPAGHLRAVAGSLAAVGAAFFPKCPACWSAYLSAFGIAGLESVASARWLLPTLAALVIVNLACAANRARAARRYWPVALVAAGAATILVFRLGLGWDAASLPGVALTLVGSVAGVAHTRRRRWLAGPAVPRPGQTVADDTTMPGRP